MKITLRFSKGQFAVFDRGEWTCADETLLVICKRRTPRISPEMQPDRLLRTVRLFAGRMNAALTIEIPPPAIPAMDIQTK